MPPKRRNTRNSRREPTPTAEETMEQIITRRVADAIAQYEANRSRNDQSGPNGETPATGNPTPSDKGCSYKTFMSCKPDTFKGTEGAIGVVHWIEKMESVLAISGCARDCQVKYAACTFAEKALTWWNAQVKSLGLDAANAMPWDDFKTLLLEEFCPQSELQEVETELWEIKMVGADISGYTSRFQELARLVPHMVTPEKKRIERYIKGLVPQIRSMVTTSKPDTFRSAVTLAQNLTLEAVQMGTLTKKGATTKGEPSNPAASSSGEKRKWNSGGNDRQSQQNKKNPTNNRAYAATVTEPKEYLGNKPKCAKCGRHHDGRCVYCGVCKRWGHSTQACRVNPQPRGNNNRPNRACYECGDPNHYRNRCPKLNNLKRQPQQQQSQQQ